MNSINHLTLFIIFLGLWEGKNRKVKKVLKKQNIEQKIVYQFPAAHVPKKWLNVRILHLQQHMKHLNQNNWEFQIFLTSQILPNLRMT